MAIIFRLFAGLAQELIIFSRLYLDFTDAGREALVPVFMANFYPGSSMSME